MTQASCSDFTLLTWDSSHLVNKMSNCNNVCLYKHIQEFSSHHICSNCDLKMNKKINRVTKICEIKIFQHSVLSYLGPVPHRLDSFHVIYAFLIPSNINTGKSFSEALILASITNPKYDKRLFMELQVQYMKTTSPEHVWYINCSELSIQKQKNNLCTQHVVSLQFSCTELVIQ